MEGLRCDIEVLTIQLCLISESHLVGLSGCTERNLAVRDLDSGFTNMFGVVVTVHVNIFVGII